jgi:hypothetical protein
MKEFCNKCKTESEFGTRIVNKKRYLRTSCNKCENKKRVARRKKMKDNPAGRARYQRYRDKMSRLRRSGEQPERFIWMDSRGVAGKKKLEHTLSKEFIAALIKGGCKYCGETELKMTLDRIDNNLGYTESNVNPCCIRCNYFRRSVPFAAWEVIVPAVKKAVRRGLFGEWTGRCR